LALSPQFDLSSLMCRPLGLEVPPSQFQTDRWQPEVTRLLPACPIRDEEQRLLLLRNVEAKRRVAQTKLVLLLGTVLGVLIAVVSGWIVCRDIAARGLAEVTLREGEERFRNLANNISQLAWMADGKGSIFWYNQRWFDYSGTTFEEMAGWGWKKVHHPDHVQGVVDRISRCFQNGEVWEDTFPPPRPGWQLPLVPLAGGSDPRFGGEGIALVRHAHRHQREQGSGKASGGDGRGTKAFQ
jgi:PAS domain-containing protein